MKEAIFKLFLITDSLQRQSDLLLEGILRVIQGYH